MGHALTNMLLPPQFSAAANLMGLVRHFHRIAPLELARLPPEQAELDAAPVAVFDIGLLCKDSERVVEFDHQLMVASERLETRVCLDEDLVDARALQKGQE